MHKRHALLAAAFALAAWLAVFGDKTPEAAIAEPVSKPSSAARTATKAKPSTYRTASQEGPVIFGLRDRSMLIGGAGAEKPADGLFNSHSWAPAPPPPTAQLSAPPPMAPPLPFTYLGKKHEDEQWEVFLGRGDQTFIVRQQSLIEGTYRVDSIQPPTLTLTYLPMNQQQTLPIGGSD